MITRQFGIPVTSPGAILRRERDLGTPLGLTTADTTKKGGLVPDEITRILRCEPTSAEFKGQVIRSKTGRDRIARTGSWYLEVSHRTPDDLDG